MSITTDVRAYADLALEQGRNVLNQAGAAVSTANKRLATDAPQSVFAALGVADLLAATVTRQAEMLGKQAEMLSRRVETLPAGAAENVARVQETGKTLISKTQGDALARVTDLRERLDTGVNSVRALPVLSVTAASTTTVYLSNAKQAFGKLTARGEARLAELRSDPRVTRVLGDLDDVSSAVQARLAPALGSVRSEVVPYLDSAVDAIKEADLGEPAPKPARKPRTPRRATATTPAASRSTRSKAATGRGAGSTSNSTTAGSTTGGSAKGGARKAPAAKASTSARKAPAAKASTRARKAPAKKA